MPAPTTGLVLFYNMESLTGSQLLDQSPQANHGTMTGSPSVTTGTVGNARGFNRPTASSYVSVSTMITIAQSMTVCAWVNPKSVADANSHLWYYQRDGEASRFRIIGHYATAGGGTNLWLAGGGPSAGSSVEMQRAITGGVRTVWQHVLVTFSATEASAIYMNGTSITYAGTPLNWADGGRQKVIGTGWSGGVAASTFAGQIDELRVYNRILTSTEIANIYADTVNYLPGRRRGYGAIPYLPRKSPQPPKGGRD